MLKTQSKLIKYVEAVQHEIASAASDVSHPNMEKISEEVASQKSAQVEAIIETQLLVPIIGAFSAGKSSLLNAFMANAHLPVAITPETALATELHYGTEEGIEAFGAEGQLQKFPLQDFAKVTARAAEFQFLRAHINSHALKSIQPLVLVDMPGFDSPLDAHNEAIALFRDRGAHFVFLTSVEEGGLHKQALRQMREVLDTGRRFSVCLSKSDLKPEGQLKEILFHIEGQLSAEDMGDDAVIALNQSNAPQQLAKLVASIDPEFITATLHTPHLRKAYANVDASLQTVAQSLSKDKMQIAEKLSSIKSAMADLEHERDRQIRDISAPGAEDLALPVMIALKSALQSSTTDLVAAAMKDSKSLELELNEVVRSVMSREVLVATDKFSVSAMNRFHKFSQDTVKVDLQMPTDVVQIGLDTLKSPLLSLITMKLGQKAITKVAAKAVATTGMRLGGMTIGGLAGGPLGIAAAALLPELVDYLFENFKSSRKREAITQALQSDVFNQVLDQMRVRVREHMTQVAQSIVENISQDFNQRLESQRAIFSVQESQHREEASALDAKANRIEKTRTALKKLAIEVNVSA